ncbi:MAG: M20/M25/M40 family metallo-hydrolase [Pseudomonadota bacterium]
MSADDLGSVESPQVIDYDAEIQTLAARADVRQALTILEALEADNLPRLIELTEIEAPPFGEGPRAERFAELLAPSMDELEIDAEGNVLGRRAGTGDGYTLALVAHLDTVFPAGTDVTVRGPKVDRFGRKRWFAPGIGDNSRGLVLLLSLAESLAAAGIRTEHDVLFIGSVGEEGIGDLRGVKHLFREDGPRIDEFVAIDGGNDQRVLNHAIGSHRYRLKVTGPGGHSWGAFGMANPAHALAAAIVAFDQQAAAFVAEGPRTTYNVGRIGGGTSVNSVPFEAWAEVDMRSAAPEQLNALDKLFRRSVTDAVASHSEKRSRGAPLEVEFEMIGRRPSGFVESATPLIQRAMASARYFGLEPQLGSGSTDANIPIARGIPGTTISRGGVSGDAHALWEWWSDHDVVTGSSRALLLLLAVAGISD